MTPHVMKQEMNRLAASTLKLWQIWGVKLVILVKHKESYMKLLATQFKLKSPNTCANRISVGMNSKF